MIYSVIASLLFVLTLCVPLTAIVHLDYDGTDDAEDGHRRRAFICEGEKGVYREPRRAQNSRGESLNP